jgi:hypothetical protein
MLKTKQSLLTTASPAAFSLPFARTVIDTRLRASPAGLTNALVACTRVATTGHDVVAGTTIPYTLDGVQCG